MTTSCAIINHRKIFYVGVIFLPQLAKKGYAVATNDPKYYSLRLD